MANWEVKDNQPSHRPRKRVDLNRAVKGHWENASWHTRHEQRQLETQLQRYRKQKQKKISFLNWKKFELERRLTEHSHIPPRTSEKIQNIPGEHGATESIGYLIQGNKPRVTKAEPEQTTINVGGKVESKQVFENDWLRRDRSVSTSSPAGKEERRLLPLRQSDPSKHIDRRRKTMINVGFGKGLSHSKIQTNTVGERMTKSLESIPDRDRIPELEKASMFPDISIDSKTTFEETRVWGRARSFTVSEKSNVYAPKNDRFRYRRDTREESITKNAKEAQTCLKEQFEKLQSCRYLRPSVFGK